jgi:hypothetical protein
VKTGRDASQKRRTRSASQRAEGRSCSRRRGHDTRADGTHVGISGPATERKTDREQEPPIPTTREICHVGPPDPKTRAIAFWQPGFFRGNVGRRATACAIPGKY